MKIPRAGRAANEAVLKSDNEAHGTAIITRTITVPTPIRASTAPWTKASADRAEIVNHLPVGGTEATALGVRGPSTARETPMEPLTAPAVDTIIQRMEDVVTELEDNPSAYAFYFFVLLAEAFSETKHAVATIAPIRRCLTIASRMETVRSMLLPGAIRWHPLADVLALLHAEAARLTTLYGVARPTCRLNRRELQQAFHANFQHVTGKVYHTYDTVKTPKERLAISTFWHESLSAALAELEADGGVQALDQVMACLASWTNKSHERWSKKGWREPTPKDVVQGLIDFLAICATCHTALVEAVQTGLEQTPLIDRAHATQEVEPRYAVESQTLREHIQALQIPADADKARKSQLRKEKTQLQQTLKALVSAQEAEIARQIKSRANARHKIEMLAKMVNGYPHSLLRKFGKACVDALPGIIWIYQYEQEADETWRQAKRDARRFMRHIQQAQACPEAVAAV